MPAGPLAERGQPLRAMSWPRRAECIASRANNFELKCELLQPHACHFGRTGGVEPLGNVLCNPSVVILLRAGGKPRRTGRLSDVWGEWVRLYLRF